MQYQRQKTKSTQTNPAACHYKAQNATVKVCTRGPQRGLSASSPPTTEPLFQTVTHQFLQEEAVGKWIESLAEAQVDEKHHFSHVSWAGYFVVEDNQVFWAWFILDESAFPNLALPNHMLHVTCDIPQEDIQSITFPGTEVKLMGI